MSGTEQKSKPTSRPVRVGVVRSISGDKTISVMVNTLVKHRRYGKYVRRRTKLTTHDPDNQAGVGDLVEIVQCRRLSRSKAWRLVRVVRRSVAQLGPKAD